MTAPSAASPPRRTRFGSRDGYTPPRLVRSPTATRTDARRRPAARFPASNVARLRGAPRLPVAVELFFAIAVRRIVASYIGKIVPAALRLVDDFAKPSFVRKDARGADEAEDVEAVDPADRAREAKRVTSHMRAVARRALRTGLPQLEARSQKAADRARRHSKNELGRLGFVVKKEPEMRALVDGWRKDNVAKITGLADEHLDRIEGILAEGFNKHPKTIAKQLKDLGVMSDKRAELIARDQVLTLNAKINRHRQQAAGVESYVWTTQNDDRVRDEHADLDGEEFDWDSGGDEEEGHPGEPVNCRCIAFPVPPSKDDEDDEGESDDGDAAEDVESDDEDDEG